MHELTATDVLCRMLDERGVEWTVPDESWNQDSITYWKVGSIKWVAFESENDTLWLNCNSVTDLTPEQAIAATLGTGTCKLTRASWDDGTCTWGCICSACDAHLEHETGIGYNYCPICGRRIEQ